MITITIQPQTTEHVKVIAAAMASILAPEIAPKAESAAKVAKKQAPPAVVPDEEPELIEPAVPTAATAPTVTKEQVRAKLAELNKTGKGAEAKALIASYGVTTLTAVPEDKLAELLMKAGAI
jgi:hypothetical protein